MIVKNVEKKEHSTVLFQVEIDAATFEEALNKAYRAKRSTIMVPGFRKGKASRKVIEGMYGADIFYEDAAQYLAPDAFDFGVEEAKLDTVGAPSFLDFSVDDNKALTLVFGTDVFPEVVLGEYMNLEGIYDEEPVADEEIADELNDIQKRHARMVDVDRPVKAGDNIVFDFEGYMDGVAFEGGKGENYTLEIGSGAFIPGFEDQLIGMPLEKDGEVNVTFPENYAEDLSGKNAVFKVRIHSIREPQYPEMDDEFAKDISEFDTIEAFKANLREKMEEQRRTAAEHEFKSQLIYTASSNITCDIPDSMVEDKIDDFLRGYAENIGMPGNVSRSEIVKMIGIDEESFISMIRPNAVMQARADLLLDKIVEVENIEIGPEEKDAFYKKLEEDYGEQAEAFKAMINEELMVRDLSRRKAAELIYNSGVKKAINYGGKTDSEAESVPAEEKQD